MSTSITTTCRDLSEFLTKEMPPLKEKEAFLKKRARLLNIVIKVKHPFA